MGGWTLSSVLSLALAAAFLSTLGAGDRGVSQPQSAAKSDEYERQYQILWTSVEDRTGLEAIRSLHQQLDDDNDGTIEPSETGDFIKADLQHGLHELVGEGEGPKPLEANDAPRAQYDGDGSRMDILHRKDKEITVLDLWSTWSKSEVHNWTVEQTAEWLAVSVELPQYQARFIKEGVTGSQLPKAAVDTNFLQHKLGITSSLHRSKISLKAMDVVLFGPPKNSWYKDVILTSLLLALLTALFWAYRTKKHSEEHLSKMMKDMESLAKAERALQDMQSKMHKQEKVIRDVKVKEKEVKEGGEEVGRLREEVEILRGELQRAEVELEDKCWMAPTMLQHWLQLTYELESGVINSKKKAAEGQMEAAKDACDKLKKKRSSLVGAFVSTHGRSIEDVDKSILEAKTALMELTQDISERSQRWRQIEMLTGVSIVNNPGIHTLQRLVRHVGGGNRGVRGSDRLSSRMSSVSVDDLRDDFETRSVAASHSSHLSSSRLGAGYTSRRQTRDMVISRESSKESSEESDETGISGVRLGSGGRASGHRNKLVKQQSRGSEMSASSGVSDYSGLMMTALSPDDKRSLIRTDTTSIDQPEPESDLQPACPNSPGVSLVKSANSSPNISGSGPDLSLTPSSSDTALNLLPTLRVSGTFPSHLSEVEESCSASDTGSINDLDKKKKKRSFFNFRKKKEKAVS